MTKNLKSFSSKVCVSPTEEQFKSIKSLAEKIKNKWELEESVDSLDDELVGIFNNVAREFELQNQTPRSSDKIKYLEKIDKKSKELIGLIEESGNSISFGLLPDWHDRAIFNLKNDLTILSQTCFEQKSKLTADEGGARKKDLERVFIDLLIELYKKMTTKKLKIYKQASNDGYAGEFFKFSICVIDEFKKFEQLKLKFVYDSRSIGALIHERVKMFNDPQYQMKLKEMKEKIQSSLVLLNESMDKKFTQSKG